MNRPLWTTVLDGMARGVLVSAVAVLMLMAVTARADAAVGCYRPPDTLLKFLEDL